MVYRLEQAATERMVKGETKAADVFGTRTVLRNTNPQP